MRRELSAVFCAVLVLVLLAAGGAWASTSGGGTQRWTASYREGSPAYSTATVVSPDGATVFVTGTTAFGPSGRFATLAYDSATGDQKWVSTFLGKADSEFGRGLALAVSPDGSTLFVTGTSRCGTCNPSFEGFSTLAYDASTGEQLWVARFAGDVAAHSIAVTPDGSMVFVNGQRNAGEASAIVAYDPSTGEQLWVVESEDRVVNRGGLTVSPDSSTVYVTGTAPPGQARCFSTGGFHTTAYDTSDGAVRWSSPWEFTSTNHCGTATNLGLSPDGSKVFVTGYGGGASGWFKSATVAYDARTGAQLWATQDDNIRVLGGDTVISLGVSPDGSKAFVLGHARCQDSSCPGDPLVTLAYDTTTGNRLWVSRYSGGGEAYAEDLAVSPDGSTVFVTGQENMPCFDPCTVSRTDAPLVAYDAETGDERWATRYADNTSSALAVSPDGSSVYLAGTFTSSSVSSARLFGRTAAASCSSTCGFATASYNIGPGPGRVQESDHSLRYNSWETVFDKTALGGAFRASDVKGATATFRTPKVTSIDWLTHLGPNQGRAYVSIDGQSKGTFNLYDPNDSASSFTFKNLPRTTHTVRVKVLGRKDAASTGTSVAVDAFKVRVGAGIREESSPKIRFDSWTGVSTAAASGGSYRASGSPAARMSLGFTGRSVSWITARGPAYGRARVVIDGQGHTVDLYRRTRTWQVPVTYTGLGRGQHRITVRPLGRKDAASTTTNVVVDAFVVRS